MSNGSTRTSNFVTKLNLGLLTCHTAKPIYWHWVVIKEIKVFISGCQARRMGSSCSKDLNSLMAFREGFLKATFRVRVAAHGLSSDWLVVRWQGDVSGILTINLPVPTSLGSTVLVSVRSPPPPGWRSCFLQNKSKICVGLLCISLEEELGLCFITDLLFKLSLLFLLDSFSFVSVFPHFPN